MTRKINGSIQSIFLTMAHESHDDSILWAYVSYPNVEGLKKIEAIVLSFLSLSEAFTTWSEACLCASPSSPWYNWTSNGENKIPSLWVPSHWFIRLCMRNSPLIRYVTQMNFKGGLQIDQMSSIVIQHFCTNYSDGYRLSTLAISIY